MTSSTVQTAAPRMGSDAISSWAENPLFHVSRVAIGFLQGLFEFAPEGCFKWNEDSEKTQLIITDELPIDYDVVNKRPAITPVRSTAAFGNVTMDNLMELNLKTGARTHSDLVSGHLTFNCLSRVKVEAEQLAWLVARHIWILRRFFLRSGFHEFGLNFQIGSPSPAGLLVSGAGDTEILVVPATSPFRFQWTEQITPQNLSTLQSIEACIEGRIRNVPLPTDTAEGPGSSGPGIRGTAIGANYSNQMNASRSNRGNIRLPTLRGRTLVPVPKPGSQPGEADPCGRKVIT